MRKPELLIYLAPDIRTPNSGPTVRGLGLLRAAKSNTKVEVICGSELNKLVGTLRSSRTRKVYFETKTNRLSVIDFVCLLVLRWKSEALIIYIRDVYLEAFGAARRTGLRQALTAMAHGISGKCYRRLGSELAFPTEQMRDVYLREHKSHTKSRALPPKCAGWTDPAIGQHGIAPVNQRPLLFMGSSGYEYVGWESLWQLYSLPEWHAPSLHVISRDRPEDIQIPRSVDEAKLKILELNAAQLNAHVESVSPIALLHLRPRNHYDDMTVPIKVMTSLSWSLPIITMPHSPLVALLGADYPFFFRNIAEVPSLVERIAADEHKARMLVHRICLENQYESTILELLGHEIGA